MIMAEDERPVVAYLGPEGSYTHQAALSAFPSNTTQISPQTTISDVFSAVQSRTAHRGVVPFENSSNGSVVFTLDLFADIQGKYPDILVCGEAYVEVRHCLLGHASPSPESPTRPDPTQSNDPSNNQQHNANDNNPATPAQPLNNLSKIKTLYSHPQAWGQCNVFLTQHLKHAERRDVSSTSHAAELVSQDPSGTSAALSSIIAAELFGLDVLAKSINDRVGNTTRFLVIKRKDAAELREVSLVSQAGARSIAAGSSKEEETRTQRQEQFKSLVTFTPDNDTNPGALAACLSAFAKYDINLTSINTRPSGVKNWKYIFFVEFQGRLDEEDGEDGKGVKAALQGLGRVCRGYRWLGSWVDRTPMVG
ncbi:PDT-domain-containing protein [Plenodomus tracheiphilus IPT5]|uniref:prephenate dehydratase n=1 Tax=Plenodomus tracheiphilus IPT5 TaxID=1408161 RepID=A0A6A7AVH0_9PLEO|nr:PDT-domain-containing protein [Plenodomus tracheiphilus IPT5]